VTLNYVTLACDLGAGDGYYLKSGTGFLVPSAVVTDTADHIIVSKTPIPVMFCGPQPPQVRLLATDNANLLPAGWAWTFTPPPGTGIAPFSFFLSFANGATQYLSAQIPVQPAAAMGAYLPLNHAGITDWLNVVTQFGAAGDNSTDSTAAIQAAINTAAGSPGTGVYIPAGLYRVSQLTLKPGTILRGSSAGTYPDEDSIPGVSVLVRIASTNLDLLLAPDGTNYCRIFDLAIDGNKNNNTAGCGLRIADGAAGQEAQFIIERCFFHDNPDSNIYLGNNRRANKVQYSVLNYSANGDGITVCGSDNLIMSCICGSNARAGINLGSTVSQNWASFGSNKNSTTTHVFNNDIYGNQVGIAIPSNAARSMIIGNGIDRNSKQGITVYNADCNTIVGNVLHSNGQAANKTYAHIDLASGVGGVVIDGNTFGPLDGGITNLCTTCVNVASFATAGVITGGIGQADTISPDTVSGLINSAANTPPATRLSNAGALIQGSGNNILELKNTSGTTVTKVTGGGSFVHSGGAAQYSNAQNVMGSTAALANAILSLIGNGTGVAQLKTQLAASQTADIADFFASNGTTLLAAITAGGAFQPGNGSAAGGHIYSGSGAPNITGSAAGDFYFRTDTPSTANQRIYVATAANTWTGIA